MPFYSCYEPIKNIKRYTFLKVVYFIGPVKKNWNFSRNLTCIYFGFSLYPHFKTLLRHYFTTEPPKQVRYYHIVGWALLFPVDRSQSYVIGKYVATISFSQLFLSLLRQRFFSVLKKDDSRPVTNPPDANAIHLRSCN